MWKARYKEEEALEVVVKLMKAKAEKCLAVPLARDEQRIKCGCSVDDPVVEFPQGDFVIENSDPVVCFKRAVHH
ncbi:LOW QUALITY PROTEIN: hypothetical protein HJC23_003211 [Cyclotella cryptica]|uniref:Uncharacterized protein n=1 Tax=Cyclotella cryptica TaxID=29204 RepID=A0ABD3PED1_9STRA